MRTSLVPVVALALAIVVAVPAAAQDDDSQQKPAQAAATRVAPPPPSPASSRLKANVQIDLTITDQIGTGPSVKKSVSMIAAHGTWGKIRAAGVAKPSEALPYVNVGLNVDARPFVFPEGVVQVELTIGYNPLGPEPKSMVSRPTELNQSMTVSLTDGKPMIVSQAADPVVDRKIIVEVTATILK